MKANRITRRNFISRTALATGVASVIPLGVSSNCSSVKLNDTHEVWIAGLSQMGSEC